MEKQGKKMSQLNRNGDAAGNPNKRRSLYLANIIFLSCLTIAALVFALFVFFRLRRHGTDGFRQFCTDGQLKNIEEKAAEDARKELLLEIQSSLESGRSTTQMLREIFDDCIVVVSGGRYYFYPLLEEVDHNPLEIGMLTNSDGLITYAGENPDLHLSRGILLSDDNGKIDWERLGDSGIEEIVLSAGDLEGDRFIPDQQFERNCRKAVEKGKRISLCLEVSEPPADTAVDEAMTVIGKAVELYGLRDLPQKEESTQKEENTADQGDMSSDGAEDSGAGQTSEPSQGEAGSAEAAIDPTILFRLRAVENLSDDGSDKTAWTDSLKLLGGEAQAGGLHPVIGTDLHTCAAQIDLSGLSEYERWVIDHEETLSFPYSFDFWEYSAEGNMEGVPGKSILYVRVEVMQ